MKFDQTEQLISSFAGENRRATLLMPALRSLVTDLATGRYVVPKTVLTATRSDHPPLNDRREAQKVLRTYDQATRQWAFEFLMVMALEAGAHDGYTVARLDELAKAFGFDLGRRRTLIESALSRVYGCPFNLSAANDSVQIIVVAVVATMIFSDQQLHVRELNHLKELMNQCLMAEIDIADLSKWQNQTSAQMIASLPAIHRLMAVYQALRLIVADQVIRAAEVRAFNDMVASLEVSFEITRRLVLAIDVERGVFSPQLA